MDFIKGRITKWQMDLKNTDVSYELPITRIAGPKPKNLGLDKPPRSHTKPEVKIQLKKIAKEIKKGDISEDGEVFLYADNAVINRTGDSLFIRDLEPSNVCFAKGYWKAFYAASVMDGSPVAVEHWKSEILEDSLDYISNGTA